jgi:hypothetical protein
MTMTYVFIFHQYRTHVILFITLFYYIFCRYIQYNTSYVYFSNSTSINICPVLSRCMTPCRLLYLYQAFASWWLDRAFWHVSSLKTNISNKMTTLFWCLVKRSYMFRRTNATIREFIWSSQATYISACITGRIMEYRAKQFQSVLLHYGYKWVWLTAAGSSGLLWNTA